MSTATVPATQLQQLFGHAGLANGNAYSQHIFHRLHQCHTAAMGMHHYMCDDKKCNHLHQQYHSCGNRHCPNCGGLKKEQWIEKILLNKVCCPGEEAALVIIVVSLPCTTYQCGSLIVLWD